MTNLQQFTGGAGHTLLALAMVLALANRFGWRARPATLSTWAAIAAVALTVWIPWGNTSLVANMRGVLGDLSITLMILLFAYVVEQLSGEVLISPSARRWILVGVAIGAALLYPMTLGLSGVDPYRLGFQPTALLVVLLAIVLVCWRRQPAVALVVLAALIAANLNLLESTNLWDYLLDIWLTLAVVVRSLSGLVRMAVARGTGFQPVEPAF